MCSGAVHGNGPALSCTARAHLPYVGKAHQHPAALPLLCSKSDAMAVLFASDGYKSERWSEVGRTDTVANSLTPEFRKPLRATYQVCGSGVGWERGIYLALQLPTCVEELLANAVRCSASPDHFQAQGYFCT